METETMPTIKDFIEQEGTGMIAEKRTSRHDRLMTDKHMTRHFECTLHRGKQETWEPRHWEREMVVWFSQGSAHTKPPTAEDVLDCMASDSSGYENARNFEDWASEYGYDTDSRTAERIYHTVAEQAKELKHFLGAEAYERLLWNTERL